MYNELGVSSNGFRMKKITSIDGTRMSYTNLMYAQNSDFSDDEFGETQAANLAEVDGTQIATQSRNTGRRGNFTPELDKLLVSAWINVSKDPIIGNDQKIAAFWQRIADYFNNHLVQGRDTIRTKDSLKSRWKIIRPSVSKFNACFTEIERQNRSGTTDVDKLIAARELYRDNHGSNFPHEHCWLILRHEQKWIHSVTPVMASPSAQASASINLEDERPIGRKADKAAKRKSSDVSGPSKMFENQFVDYQDLKLRIYVEKTELQREHSRLAKVRMDFEMQKHEDEQQMRAFEKKKYEDEQEEMILNIDTSKMEPTLAYWYEHKKREILVKYTQGCAF